MSQAYQHLQESGKIEHLSHIYNKHDDPRPPGSFGENECMGMLLPLPQEWSTRDKARTRALRIRYLLSVG